ncbi:MAG: hypothetical protein AAGF73_00900 [Actinomycetota bacterium]
MSIHTDHQRSTAPGDFDETRTTKVFVRFEVEDYDTWRAVFETRRAAREAAGIRNMEIFRDPSGPSSVLFVADACPEMFLNLMNKPEQRAGMEKAGVIYPIQIFAGDPMS